MPDSDAKALAAEALRLYQSGDFAGAARLFGEAASGFQSQGDDLDSAEMKNNQSVAFLQAGSAQEAYDVVRGTADIFSTAGDFRRQGMAYGNEASALSALGRQDQAIQSYQTAAAALEKGGEDQLRASVLQAVAALQFRKWQVMQALLSLRLAVTGLKNPTLKQKIMRGLLRLIKI